MHYVKCPTCINSVTSPSQSLLRSRNYSYLPHSRGKENKVQRGYITCPGLHRQNFRQVDFRVPAFDTVLCGYPRESFSHRADIREHCKLKIQELT